MTHQELVKYAIEEALHALEIHRDAYDAKKSDISLAVTWLRRALGQVKPAAPEPVPWDEADVIEHLGCVIRRGLNDFLLVSETDYPEGQEFQWKKPGEPDSAFRPCCKEARR